MNLKTQIAKAILESAQAVDIEAIALEFDVDKKVIRRFYNYLRQKGFQIRLKVKIYGIESLCENNQKIVLFLQKEGYRHSLDELGKMFGVTRERARQVEEYARRRGFIGYTRRKMSAQAYAVPLELNNPCKVRREECDKLILENYYSNSWEGLLEMTAARGYDPGYVLRRFYALRKSGLSKKLQTLSKKTEERMNFVLENASRMSKSQMAQALNIHLARIYEIIELIEKYWEIKVQCPDGRRKVKEEING